MSKYKVGFMIDSRANAFSDNKEVIDLIEDYNYTEEEAKEIFGDEEKLRKIFEEWMWQTIEFTYVTLETDEDVKEFEKSRY